MPLDYLKGTILSEAFERLEERMVTRFNDFNFMNKLKQVLIFLKTNLQDITQDLK